MGAKGYIFFFFSLIITGSALTYLLLNFRTDELSNSCLTITYTWKGDDYPNTFCTDSGNAWTTFRNSFRFYRVISAAYIGAFWFYMLVNALYLDLGRERINFCNFHWILLEDPLTGGSGCGAVQGFFIAVFIWLVSIIAFLLFLCNVCNPRYVDVNQQKNYGSAENLYGRY